MSSQSVSWWSVGAWQSTDVGLSPSIRLNTPIRWQPMSIMAPPPASAFFQNQGEWGPKCASRPRIHKGLPIVPAATISMISRKSGA